MTDYPLREIWMPVLVASRKGHLTLDGDMALFAIGAECQFRIALYKSFNDGVGEFYNVANVIAMIFKIWQTGYGTGSLLLDTSDAAYIAACNAVGMIPVDIQSTVTETEFVERKKAPITIYVPASATANVTAGQRYGVLTGATNERPTQPDWFGNVDVEALQVGLGTVAAPPTPADLYVRADVHQAAYANTVKFGKNPPGRTATFVSRNTRKGRTLGCDDNGQGAGNLENY